MFDWRVLETELIEAFRLEGFVPRKSTTRLDPSGVPIAEIDAGDWIVDIDDPEGVIAETIHVTDIAKHLANALNRKVAA